MSRKLKRSSPLTSAHYLQSQLVAADVDDPYEKGAKLRVMRNLREHPLHMLAHKGVITDAQKYAGEIFRAKYERAVIGASIAIDYSKDRVDGGPTPEPLSETQQRAVEWLNDVARYPSIGKIGFAILTQICGEGHGIAETAQKWRSTHVQAGPRGEGYISSRLVECLDGLLDYMGAVAIGKRSGIRAQHND
jgi:hypothetical protein